MRAIPLTRVELSAIIIRELDQQAGGNAGDNHGTNTTVDPHDAQRRKNLVRSRTASGSMARADHDAVAGVRDVVADARGEDPGATVSG
jgi:hypothetical protein